jgi:SAM-dependent methyltransferase
VNGVFDAYAAYYDLVYRDKDYCAEAAYVLHRLGAGERRLTLLELGCGTGGHAMAFARAGHAVSAIDISPAMIEGARARVPPAECPRPTFQVGDLRTFRLGRTVDAVVSLFHVMSYQTEDADLRAAMATAAVHLGPGGLFLFDCWHGPGVLADPPARRERRFSADGTSVTRRAVPTHDVDRHVVHVDYAIDVDRDGVQQRIEERHSMRYLFPEEVDTLFAGAGFRRAGTTAWMGEAAAGTGDWYACHVGLRE